MRVLAALMPLLLLSACGGGGSPTGPSTPAAPMPPPPPGGTTVLRTATFGGANGYVTGGTAALVRDGAGHRVELSDDFGTSGSGGLDLRLCRATACGASDLNLGPLKSFAGAQSYNLPDDGGAYQYIVIWCRGFNLPFGFGELR